MVHTIAAASVAVSAATEEAVLADAEFSHGTKAEVLAVMALLQQLLLL